MSKDNAISPIYNFGKNVTRKISIDSINFKRMEITSLADRAKDFMSTDLPQEVEVRYSATIVDGDKSDTQQFLTKISFKFPGIEQKKSKQPVQNVQKKLDFTVIGYKTYKVN
jgi:type IV secretory pathway component VirB8